MKKCALETWDDENLATCFLLRVNRIKCAVYLLNYISILSQEPAVRRVSVIKSSRRGKKNRSRELVKAEDGEKSFF